MFFFLSLAASDNRNISRSLCAVNINGEVFNLSKAFTKAQLYQEGDVSFLFHPCRALQKGDFPTGALVTPDGANVYQLLPDGVWQPTNYITEFDWDPLDSGNGIIYGADGSPFLSEEGTYNRVDFDIKFNCNPDDTDPDPEYQHYIRYYRDQYGNIQTQINLLIDHAVGCGEKGHPTPTPAPNFNLCDFISRMDSDNTRGIDAHLNVLANGAWGVRGDVTFGTNNMTLFYNPCGTMTCPLEYECEDDEQESSAYLCPDLPGSENHCQSLGVAQENQMHISLYGADEREGILITYAGHGTGSEMHMKSAPEQYPDGFMFIKPVITFRESNNTFKIESYSHEADITLVPSPPQPGDEYCYKEGSFGTAKIKVNLTSYNKDSGYTTTVDVTPMSSTDATLYYQPCGGLSCPKNHSCKGIEDSTVLLCYDDQTCRSYGMIENNVSIAYDSYDLNKGFTITYIADQSKAVVQYECNESAEAGEIQLPTTVVRNGEQLSFTVRSKDVCPDSPLPPTPTWYLPTPKPYSSPLPEPMRSPNPINFYANDTHFIVLNLDEMRDDKLNYNTIITYRGNNESVYFTYEPWKQHDCPSSKGKCQVGKNVGNSYLCYMTSAQENVCYSYADIEYDAHLDLIKPPNLDAGVDLTYNSQWDTDLSIALTCDEDLQFNILSIDTSAPLVYGKGMYGEVISAIGTSKNACPIAFAQPELPNTPSPTPEPSPLPQSAFFYRTAVRGNVYLELNLSKIASRSESIYLGDHQEYRKSKIYFDPDQPKPCYQDECLGGGETNIWRCFDYNGKNTCYGIGDARQSLTFTEGDDFNAGITVTYGGGYSNYKTSIQFVCNESVQENTIDFDDIGVETSMHTITLFAHTSDVCPKFKGPTPLPTITPEPEPTPSVLPGSKSVTGGSVFLLIVTVGFGAYLVIGMIVMYKIKGRFEIPNETFWTEFGTNVATGTIFLFTCGRKHQVGATGYDTI